MTDEMPRQHPRSVMVREASRELDSALDCFAIERTMDDVDLLMAVVRVQEDTLRTMIGLPPLDSSRTQGMHAVVAAVSNRFGLTPVELLRALLSYQLDRTRYLLRTERHPNDPNALADVAADEPQER